MHQVSSCRVMSMGLHTSNRHVNGLTHIKSSCQWAYTHQIVMSMGLHTSNRHVNGLTHIKYSYSTLMLLILHVEFGVLHVCWYTRSINDILILRTPHSTFKRVGIHVRSMTWHDAWMHVPHLVHLCVCVCVCVREYVCVSKRQW